MKLSYVLLNSLYLSFRLFISHLMIAADSCWVEDGAYKRQGDHWRQPLRFALTMYVTFLVQFGISN